MADDSATQTEPEVVDADQVAELVQPLPEVNAAAIDAAREQEAQAQADEGKGPTPAPAAAPAAAPLPAGAAAEPDPAAQPRQQRTRVAVTDEKGRPFSPLLHECTDDGQPIMRSAPNDRWVRCRRQPLKEWRRKSVVGEDPAPAAAQPEAPAAPPIDAGKQLIAAQTMAGLQIMAMRVALGDKIAQADAEREQLTASWLAVCQHYDLGGNFHPLVGLALVSGSLVVGAMRHEDTRSRMTKLWDWAQLKALSLWQVLRGGRMRSRPQPAQQQPEPAQRAAA
jgi:hypothetical protein